jgi:type VI secretion system secreted protein Hcp
MATDMFLKLANGIQGETKDSKHSKEIDVMSFSWGVSNPTSSYGGGLSAGKSQFGDFSFTFRMCTASPKLALSCASGEHIKDATLTCRKSGKTPQEYLVFKFYDLLVSSYQTGYSQGQDEAFDSCSMSYAKLEWSYKPQKADGSLDAALDFKYDLKTNVAS